MSAGAAEGGSIERVVVLGAGAVGGSIGGLLAEAGTSVVLVARGEHGKALAERGLTVRLPERSFVVTPPCVGRVSDVDWRPGDVAMLATKLQDAEALLDELRQCAAPEVPVVCAVNGVHGERWAAERFLTVLSMLVWVPATHLSPGEVRLHSAGSLGVLDTGPYDGCACEALADELCHVLERVGFEAVMRHDIERWKLAKWMTNLGGAAQAMVEDDWRSVADAARAEGEEVLRAARLDPIETDELLERVAGVRCEPVDGQPREGGSTWQSFARGRPLESRWLEGALADLASEVGAAAPINAFLAELARAPRRCTAAEVLAATRK